MLPITIAHSGILGQDGPRINSGCRDGKVRHHFRRPDRVIVLLAPRNEKVQEAILDICHGGFEFMVVFRGSVVVVDRVARASESCGKGVALEGECGRTGVLGLRDA